VLPGFQMKVRIYHCEIFSERIATFATRINYDRRSRIGKTIAFSPKSNTEIRLALGIERVGRHGNLNNESAYCREKK